MNMKYLMIREMPLRWKLLIIITPLAVLSTWLFHAMEPESMATPPATFRGPDYYMININAVSMNDSGQPANTLQAVSLEHYSELELTNLEQPQMKVFRDGEQPFHITADNGQVRKDNEIILLKDNVVFWQNTAEGVKKLEVLTSEAMIYTVSETVETDKPATLIHGNTRTTADGMRAHVQESRLELLSNVYTTLNPDYHE
ncbi:MAG: LPS export ABC transporter periplasmic protein LptC [Gammaproteobacteria bacterium]|nr:LPS export ABC transporter periplasmic protein LptC [Gammaproteobacteria bacterium]NIO62855.1 LPS export ABC transporter periplasmic protein LptC [Gammaproteobacteria bacterium]NIX17926.1 LPS export ABC transporter periplasmic protein LptC [Gammaproteobacteria bacterium]